MKIRILSTVCVTIAVTLLAACTAVYKNSDACEQAMRSKLAETSPDTLKITHTGSGIDGSRVVVEGSIEHVTTASEVAAATAASTASTTKPADAPRVAAPLLAASGATVSAGSGAAASASIAASAAKTASPAAAKPKTTTTAAAAECTFHGSVLGAFSWLAPATLIKPADGASEATE
jgi:hypothetical protein